MHEFPNFVFADVSVVENSNKTNILKWLKKIIIIRKIWKICEIRGLYYNLSINEKVWKELLMKRNVFYSYFFFCFFLNW